MSFDNLVLIPSIIDTPNIALSYTETRSVYSKKERYEQTKKTISSVREKIPNCKILMVECSVLDDEEYMFFTQNTDYFINLFDTPYKSNIYSIYKALGEGTMTAIALEYILQNNIIFDNFIKITGRYWLDDNFNYSNIIPNKAYFRIINSDFVSTCLYSIPYSLVSSLYEFLLNSNKDFICCAGYEHIIRKFIHTISDEFILNVSLLGVSGYISVCGDLIET
jgi:hypothetical protein